MKKLLLLSLLLPSFAYASDDAVDCSKKDGVVKCTVKKDHVIVDAISVNGDECAVPADPKIFHHAFNKGDKFSVPVTNGDSVLPIYGDCGYVRIVTIKTHDGKKKTFNAL